MGRLTVALVLFVVIGIAAAFPDLNQGSKSNRLKRALKQLKSRSFNLFDPSEENTLNVRELEGLLNMLKREGEAPENAETETAGSTETGKDQGGKGKEQGGKGKGGKGKGSQEQGGQEKGEQDQGDSGEKKSGDEEYKGWCEEESPMETIMMYVDDLEHTDAFRELIDLTMSAVKLAMSTVNSCTEETVFDLTSDVQELKTQAEIAYNVGMDEFVAELEKLGQAYQNLAIIGHEAAVNSNTWNPMCTKVTELLGEQIHYLNVACYLYRLDQAGYINLEDHL